MIGPWILTAAAVLGMVILYSFLDRELRRADKMRDRWAEAKLDAKRWKAAAQGQVDPITGRKPPPWHAHEGEEREHLLQMDREDLVDLTVTLERVHDVLVENYHDQKARVRALEDALEKHERSCGVNTILGREPDP